jgi:hypothetical protein
MPALAGGVRAARRAGDQGFSGPPGDPERLPSTDVLTLTMTDKMEVSR